MPVQNRLSSRTKNNQPPYTERSKQRVIPMGPMNVSPSNQPPHITTQTNNLYLEYTFVTKTIIRDYRRRDNGVIDDDHDDVAYSNTLRLVIF